MNAIKAEDLDVYCLLDSDKFIVILMMGGRALSTFEYPIIDLTKEFIASLKADSGLIEGDDADYAYELVDSLEYAADLINISIED